MNKSISDFVAASMDAVLKSEEHKSLFKNYKTASDNSADYSSVKDMNDAKKHKKKCEDCEEDIDNCYCDSMNVEDLHSGWDDESQAWDENNGMTSNDMLLNDEMLAHNGTMHSTAALDVAIDSLLTASAALDSVGMDSGSTVSLKLASMVVEAKKAMTKEEKKKLMERLNKGKKNKSSKDSKPSKSSGKSTPSSSSSKSTSSKSTSSSDLKKKSLTR